MSNKVIRWFKRQASLRKSSEKNDDKTPVSPNNSDEKKKLGFPRLSFRRKNKKKTSFEAAITPALVGISKRFSLSVPREMASHTSGENHKSDLPTSISEGFVSVSLTNSPSKSEGDSSVASELPSHSSIDYTKDSSQSPTEQEITSEANTEVKTSSELSEAQNCDSQPTFHSNSSVNSPTKAQSHSILGDGSIAAFSETPLKDAPIVKMEEICDNESCMKSSDEVKTVEVTEISSTLTDDQNSFSGAQADVIESSQIDECERKSEANKNDHTDFNLNTNLEENASEFYDTDLGVHKSEDKNTDSTEYNVFEEIERLVNDSILLAEEGENYDKGKNENRGDDNAPDRSDFGPSTDQSDNRLSKESGTSDNEQKINDLEHTEKNIEVLHDSRNNDATDRIDEKKFQPGNETVFNEDSTPANNSFEIECSNTNKPSNNDLKITVSKEEDRKLISNDFQSDGTKTGLNKYPKDLNPFSDDSDDNTIENRWSAECGSITRNLENENINETELFIRETNINSELDSFSSQRSRRRFAPSKYLNSNPELTIGTSIKSLNPFDESDDEESNPVNEERSDKTQVPPLLPPKSLDRSNRRKYSTGCLAPIPYPRRSKLSHYGSYTSLQNMPVAPIPAPRSFAHTGSTRTLNESTNPFGDDWEDEEEDKGSFDRRVLGRSTMQGGSSPCVQGPFRRSTVTGSLPPALRIRVRKKRQAPLPPKLPHSQPVTGPGDSEASPSSSQIRNPSDVRSSNPGGEMCPFPPPRPPPPKLTPPNHDPVFV